MRTRLLVAAALVCALVAAALPAAAAPAAVRYQAPADAVVTHLFAPPSSAYGSGNRGVDYATAAGDTVRAAADGVVAFAGQVGGAAAVSILHADGIRTTYTFLARATVRRGQAIKAGEPVGAARGAFHFGAVANGGVYLDPLLLLSAGPPASVRLVPDRIGSPEKEKSLLASVADAARQAARQAARELTERGAEFIRDAAGLVIDVGTLVVTIYEISAEWIVDAMQCTSPSVAPPKVGRNRVVITVGGFGSNSNSAGIEAVDTTALGYAPGAAYRFSYAGGSTRTRAYGPRDTFGPLDDAAARFAEMYRAVKRDHPGAQIDVVAHSQGGVVALAGIRRVAAAGEQPSGHLVALGSPFGGADLAGAHAALGGSVAGRAATKLASAITGAGAAGALGDLAPGSPFLKSLDDVPPGMTFTSIAAAQDIVVPMLRSHHDAADNRVVHVPGGSDHGALPGSQEARREVALALNGMGETCRSLAHLRESLITGGAITGVERFATEAVEQVAERADGAVRKRGVRGAPRRRP